MVSELNLINKDKLNSFLKKPVNNSINKLVGNINWIG